MKKIHENKNNKKFNSTVNKVHSEMDSALKSIGNWCVKCSEKYSDVYCYDLQFLSSEDIVCLESKYAGVYDLSRYKDDSKREGQAIERVTLQDDNGDDYVCEFRKVDWLLTNSKIVRSFSFVNTGCVSYSQIKRNRDDNDKSYDYYAVFDVNNNELTIRFVNNDVDISFINSSFRQYVFGNKTIAEDERSITLIENKDDYSRLEIEFDRAGNVIRKHLIHGDYNYVIEGDDIVSAFVGDNKIESDVGVNDIIASFEIGKIDDYKLFDYISGVKSIVINAIKSVKGDVPIEGLLRRLDVALSTITIKKVVHPEIVKKEKKKKLR